jgi:hypothetical protein
MTKKIIIVALFTILGFIIGYAFFADIGGFNIDLKTLLFGPQSGFDFVDNLADAALNSVRQRVLTSTLAGMLLGIISLFTFLKKIAN